jgi:hypothetical protein
VAPDTTRYPEIELLPSSFDTGEEHNQLDAEGQEQFFTQVSSEEEDTLDDSHLVMSGSVVESADFYFSN